MKTKEELKEFYKNLYPDNHVPYSVKRTSDGSILLMNNDFKTYSFVSNEERNTTPYRYSYRRLFDDDRVKPGDFEVEGYAPIDNLFRVPEEYFTHRFQKVELDG